jgi:hypothetical protein
MPWHMPQLALDSYLMMLEALDRLADRQLVIPGEGVLPDEVL